MKSVFGYLNWNPPWGRISCSIAKSEIWISKSKCGFLHRTEPNLVEWAQKNQLLCVGTRRGFHYITIKVTNSVLCSQRRTFEEKYCNSLNRSMSEFGSLYQVQTTKDLLCGHLFSAQTLSRRLGTRSSSHQVFPNQIVTRYIHFIILYRVVDLRHVNSWNIKFWLKWDLSKFI